MNIFDLAFWQGNIRAVGVVAIIVGAGAWALELSGIVYVCPYCRVQRTVILLLGIMMLLPFARHWIARYFSLAIGWLGLVVAADQNFMSWKKISAGEFVWGEHWYIHSFLLSTAAIFFLIAQVYLILTDKPSTEQAGSDGGS